MAGKQERRSLYSHTEQWKDLELASNYKKVVQF